MYDITVRDSFISLIKWVNDINCVIDIKKTCVILIGNKSDL